MKCSRVLRLAAAVCCVAFLARCTAPVQAQDHLGVAVPYVVTHIEPFARQDPLTRLLLANTGYGLTRFGAHGLVELELAARVQRSADARDWTCQLRDGVLFSSQRHVYATDVKSSFEFYERRAAAFLQNSVTSISLTANAPYEGTDTQARGYFTPLPPELLQRMLNIQSIDIVGTGAQSDPAMALVVSFHLKESDEDFDRDILTLPVVDTKIADLLGPFFGYNTLLPLVGPYRIREIKPGESILLEAVTVFEEAGPAPITAIEFRRYDEAKAALSALRSGSASVIAFATTALLKAIETDPTAAAVPSPLGNIEPRARWQLPKVGWSGLSEDHDAVLTDRIIIRKSLSLDERVLLRFDLSSARYTLDVKTD